jgi:hypothetical protein
VCLVETERSLPRRRGLPLSVTCGVVCSVSLILAVAGCSNTSMKTSTPESSQTSARGVPGTSSYAAGHRSEAGALTASDVIDRLARNGFASFHPVDTTVQECRTAGCEQAFVTDTLRIKSFATSTEARRYAAPRNLKQVGTIAVLFAPPLSDNERQIYWAEIVRISERARISR